LRQSIRLDAAARRLEFHGALEQSGVEQVLSASFPIAVRSLRASFETPFGVVERPTHDAADDRAARAVPGQRFAAVGEHGFGVALLSADADSVSALEGTLRLNLVGAPAPPDRAHGARHFSYAIYPHQNSWQAAEVVAEARRFTVPITWVRGQSEARSFLTCHDGNLVLDTIKRGEEGYALILRLYEAHGARGRAQIETALSFSRASVCDLLEREISPLKLSRGMLEVSYLPFQILTLKLE
jgi:alpha-mannosidase